MSPQVAGSRHQSGGIALHGGPTRRRHAVEDRHVVQNPPPTPMWGCRGTAKYGGGAARRWRGRGSVGPGTVPGTVAGRQTRQNSPGTAPPPLNPRQNSPSNLKNVKFGGFRARRANFFAHNPTTADAWSAGESKRPGRGARGRRQGTAIARQPARGLRQSTTLFAQQQPRQATSGTKLSPHTHPRRMCGTKLSQHEPHGPTSGTKLSPLARNGLIWRFFYMQGEFYTVVTTKKPSRENFVPNARQRSSELAWSGFVDRVF